MDTLHPATAPLSNSHSLVHSVANVNTANTANTANTTTILTTITTITTSSNSNSSTTTTTATAATLADSDSCPSTSLGEDAAGAMDGHDHSGDGDVALADLQHFMHTAADDDAVTVPMLLAMAHVQPQPQPQPLSSSESSLEPPPILHESSHCAYDRAAFIPITSFFHRIAPQRPTVPGLDLQPLPPVITRHHLHGDRCDFQGIDWSARNTTRAAVRARRVEYETERLSPLEKGLRRVIRPTASTDSFFRFRRNNLVHRAFVPHYQLRNILAATSRNDVFYVAGKKVFRADADGTDPHLLTDLNKRIGPESLITTLAAHEDTLITGAFDGEYSLTNLASLYGTPPTVGRTSLFNGPEKSRIVNHLHLFPSRHTSAPQAVFCSNNSHLQVLDCTTNTFTHSFAYPDSPNCAATSPDGRLRVVVGDFRETLITNAETGRPFESLKAHHDAAFACAWADDGIHVATAAQDATLVVWDARYWTRPLTVMTSQLSIPRSLHFSPLGSGGPRVLVAAEADDYVNIIDAVGWESKQVCDFFGPIGGVAFTPDGQSLFVANTERRFGGVVEMERVGWGRGSWSARAGKRWDGWRDEDKEEAGGDDGDGDDDDDDDDNGNNHEEMSSWEGSMSGVLDARIGCGLGELVV